MNKLVSIFLLLIAVVQTSAQVFQTNNQYIIIASNNDTVLYYLNTKQAIITSAVATGNIAIAVDSNGIFEVIDQYALKFGILPNNGWINRGDIYMYNNKVVRIIQSHDRSTVNHFNPHDVPALYLFRPVEGCPDWKQPTGAHDAYNINDCVTFNGKKYMSLINANVWSPIVYPAGWKLK